MQPDDSDVARFPIFGIISALFPLVAYLHFKHGFLILPFGSGLSAYLWNTWGFLFLASLFGVVSTGLSAIRVERWVLLPMLAFFFNAIILVLTLLPLVYLLVFHT